MKTTLLLLLGACMGTVIISCASGGKPSYRSLPIRSNDNSVWMECTDGDKVNACKYVCKEYSKKNECKDPVVERINIEEALGKEYYLISKTLFIKMVKK